MNGSIHARLRTDCAKLLSKKGETTNISSTFLMDRVKKGMWV